MAVRFDLAGFRVELQCTDEAWRGMALAHWGAFATERAADLTLIYEVVEVPPATAGEPVPDEPLVRFEGGVGRVSSPPLDGEIDLAAGRGVLRGPRATFPVDVVLRELLPVVRPDTIFLHASAISIEGSAWVCAGPSGSGKSTLAELCGRWTLSDELSALREREGSHHAVGMPFWTGRPGEVPLRAILLLKHGRDRHEAIRLAPAEAMRRLAPHVVWPVEVEAASARTFAVLAGLCDRVPVYRFAFLPRPDVGDFVAKACR